MGSEMCIRDRFGDGGFQAIESGSFKASLEKRTSSEERDITLLRSHDGARTLARTANGKLSVWEDDEGVHYEAMLNLEDPESLSAFVLIEDGTLDASSMGYIPLESKTVKMTDNSTEAMEAGEQPKRKVSVASLCDLLEISIVTHGVYHGASALAADADGDEEIVPDGGFVVISTFDAEAVLVAQIVHHTMNYDIQVEMETEWEGEPYCSPLVRRTIKRTINETETEDVDDSTSAEGEEDPPEGITSSESETDPVEGEENTESQMTWGQHFAELDELGVAVFAGSV